MQLKAFQQELEDIKMQVAYALNIPFHHLESAVALEYKINADIKTIKHQIREVKKDLADWKVIENLKAFLKSYKIPRGGRGLSILDMMFG